MELHRKIIEANGRRYRTGGRRRPVSFARRMSFERVVRGALPQPPSSTSYETAAMTSLRRMFLNDSLGDCVCAGRAHRIGILTANAGAPFLYTDQQVLAEYERIGGYRPGNPATDQGCDMGQAADDGVTHGYADGSKDAAWLDVDGENALQVAQAIYLFEDADIGMELPDAWLDPFPAGDDFVWDVAGDPNPNNGHCVQIVDYDVARGVKISTWGMLGWITWRALAKYASKKAYGEVIVHISPDQIAKASGKAPNGFDWANLVGFFDSFGGHLPIPAPEPAPLPPAPSPSPTPAPTHSGPTLAQAQTAASSALAKLPNYLHRSRADVAVTSALAKLPNWPA